MLLRACRSASTLALVALSAVAALAVAGCGDSPTAPSNYAPFSKTDVRAGTGAEAVNGSTLTVHYQGWLYDSAQSDQKGAQFASSAGQAAFTLTLGAGQVIEGWNQGLVGMRVGGLRRLVIPPSLAYGNSRNGPIPPNATLIFEIELLSVQ